MWANAATLPAFGLPVATAMANTVADQIYLFLAPGEFVFSCVLRLEDVWGDLARLRCGAGEGLSGGPCCMAAF